MKKPTFIVHPVAGCRSSRFPNSAHWNVLRAIRPDAQGHAISIKSETTQVERKNMRLTGHGLRFPIDSDLTGIGGSSAHR